MSCDKVATQTFCVCHFSRDKVQLEDMDFSYSDFMQLLMQGGTGWAAQVGNALH
jgi:hypothetical protein